MHLEFATFLVTLEDNQYDGHMEPTKGDLYQIKLYKETYVYYDEKKYYTSIQNIVTYDVICLDDLTHNIFSTSPRFYLDLLFGNLFGDCTINSF